MSLSLFAQIQKQHDFKEAGIFVFYHWNIFVLNLILQVEFVVVVVIVCALDEKRYECVCAYMLNNVSIKSKKKQIT